MNIFFIIFTSLNVLACAVEHVIIDNASILPSKNRTVEFPPLYNYSHAFGKITAENYWGKEKLKQVNEVQKISDKLIHLDEASEHFLFGYHGLLYTDGRHSTKYRDMMSTYYTMYVNFLKLQLSTQISQKNIDAFLEPWHLLKKDFKKNSRLFKHNQKELQSLQDLKINVANMFTEAYRLTGSPLLISPFLKSLPLITKTNPILSILDGTHSWSNDIFAENMRILLFNRKFLDDNQCFFQDPLFKADFYTRCIQKQFNPFTIQEDVNVYKYLHDLVKQEIQEVESNDQQRLLYADHILAQLKIYPHQQALQSFNIYDLADYIEPLFYSHNSEKIVYMDQLMAPLFKDYFYLNNKRLKQFEKQLNGLPAFLASRMRTYMYLCSAKQSVIKQGIETLEENPTQLLLLRAFQEVFAQQKWEHIPSLMQSLIKALPDYTYEDLQTLTLFKPYIESLERNNQHTALLNQFHAHYFTILGNKAIAAKDPLTAGTFLSHAHQYAKQLYGETFNTQYKTDDSLETQFNDALLHCAIITRTPERLEEYCQLLIQAIIKNPQEITTYASHFNKLLENIYHAHPNEFMDYITNPSRSIWLYLLNTLSFVWLVEEQNPRYGNPQKTALQHVLTSLSTTFQNKTLSLIDSNQIFDAFVAAYDAHVDREVLLALIHHFNTDAECQQLVLAKFINTIKSQSVPELHNHRLFLKNVRIFKIFKERGAVTDILNLAEFEAAQCIKKATDYGYSDFFNGRQVVSLAVLRQYCDEIRKKNKDELNDIHKNCKILEYIADREFLLWCMESDTEAALEYIQKTLKEKGATAKEAGEADKIIFDAFNKLHAEQGEAFFKCLEEKSQCEPYSLAKIYIQLIQNKTPIYDSALTLLEKQFNFALAERIIMSFQPLGKQKQWNRLVECVERNLPLITQSFDVFTLQEKTSFIEFLNRIYMHCQSGKVGIKMKELVTVWNAEIIQYIKQLSAEERKTDVLLGDIQDLRKILPTTKDSLERVVAMLEMCVYSKTLTDSDEEGKEYAHKSLNHIIQGDYLNYLRQNASSSLKLHGELLYARILFLASTLEYTKLIPKETPYESIIAQIDEARRILENILPKVSPEIFEKFEKLPQQIDSLSACIRMRYKPEEAQEQFISDFQKIYDPFVIDFDKTMKEKMQLAYKSGDLEKLAKWFDSFKLYNLNDDQKMVAAYLNHSLACLSNDQVKKENRAKKSLYYLNAINSCPEMKVALAGSLYAGQISDTVKNGNEENKYKEKFLEILYEKYKLLFNDNKKWLKVWPIITDTINKANSPMALVVSQLFKDQNDYAEALKYAQIAQCIENELFKKQSPLHSPFCLEKATRYIVELKKKTTKKSH